MHNRMIRGGILTSDRVDQIAGDAAREVFYRRLLNVVDDFGCFSADPRLLRTALYPLRPDSVTEAEIECHLAACAKAGLLVVYEVRGKRYLQVRNFRQRLQRMTNRYPPPPNMSEGDSNFQPREDEDEDEVEVEVEVEEEEEKQHTCAPSGACVGESPKRSPTPAPARNAKAQQEAWFDHFWAAYWRHEACDVASAAFETMVPDQKTFDVVMKAVAEQSAAMLEKEERYRPHAANWLNGRRWLDTPTPLRSALDYV